MGVKAVWDPTLTKKTKADRLRENRKPLFGGREAGNPRRQIEWGVRATEGAAKTPGEVMQTRHGLALEKCGARGVSQSACRSCRCPDFLQDRISPPERRVWGAFVAVLLKWWPTAERCDHSVAILLGPGGRVAQVVLQGKNCLHWYPVSAALWGLGIAVASNALAFGPKGHRDRGRYWVFY